MPAKFSQEAIAAIHGALRQFPNGATAAQILTQLPEPPDDRTLEKWINDMVACNTLRRDGVGAEARFFAVAADPVIDKPAAAAAPPAASVDPDFAEMFDLGLVMFVTAPMPREQTRSALQRQAAEHKKTGPVMKAYVEHSLARLDKFSAVDAEPYGFTPQQIAKWQQIYLHGFQPRPLVATKAVGVTAPMQPDRGSNTAPAVPDAGGANASAPPSGPTASDDSAAAAPADSSGATDCGAARPVPANVIDPFSADGLLTALHHGHGDAYKQKAFEVITSLLTPLRIGICIGLAVALKLAVHQISPFSFYIPFVIFPLAGLPWVFFRWLDETEEKRLTGREALIVLVAGGVVSVFVANGVVSLLNLLHSAAA